ncbi:unnamed protein product [Kuraishia capsulata CBS 1993]|uniref:Major facilitator superfamily (MFS) profile domain-containing protein n=1 Tax=Kuraishia capsulata CBS 1993 TaxID=1382522 RepID=W6MJT2_9ASCO|nr:uncharacterized protein KUCA_T00002219001 [Kuraishia capsulata CBS 1993]CDK26248.1 unnamed protein product [Kuraishia capsulata CBS 1993]
MTENNSIHSESAAFNQAAQTQVEDKNLTNWQTVKKYPFAVYCCFVVIWMFILCSFENQAGGIVVSIPEFRKNFGHPYTTSTGETSYVIEASWQSAFSGVPIAAGIIGQNVGSLLADRVGKKWLLFAHVLFSVAFVGLEFAATNVQMFLAGKTLNGYCVSLIQAVGVTYVAEIAPLRLRGLIVSICNVSFSIGPLICFIINYSISERSTSWAYKAVFASQWGFAAVTLPLVIFLPESPWFYALKGRVDKTEECYRKLLRDPVAAHEQAIVAHVTVQQNAELERSSSYIDCFRGRDLWRTIISVVPMVIQPMSGVYFTINYTTYFFELAGYDTPSSFRLTVGSQCLSIGGNIAAWFVVDRFGRRANLLWGIVLISVTDFIIGGAGCSSNPKAVTTTVAFMVLYGFCYNLGVGAVAYPIASENARSSLRNKTVALSFSISGAVGMMWSFVLPYIFNPDQANLGPKTMFIFAGISTLFTIYVYYFQTETANRSFEEIDEMYNNKVPFRKFKGYQTEISKVGNEQIDVGRDEKAQEAQHLETVETADSD